MYPLHASLALLLALSMSSCTESDSSGTESDSSGTESGAGGSVSGRSGSGGTEAASATGGKTSESCAGSGSLQRLSATALHELLATTDPVLIDVHVPYEGELPGTDAEIAYDDIDGIEAFVGHDRCADVILTCKSGGMSLSAGNALVSRGYLRVRDLLGGMLAWEAAGYELLDKKK